jgi:hypothetical protein
VPLLVGGLALAAVLAIGGVLLFGGGDDGEPDDDERRREEARQEEEEAREEAEAAFAVLPGTLGENSCDLEDVDDYARGVVAVFACRPAQGAQEVEATVFDDVDDVDEAFVDAQDAASETLDAEGDCETDRFATHTWTTEEDPEGVAGQVACWLDGGGNAGLVWTDDEDGLVAVATRADDGDAALYEWWADLVGRGAVDDGFPNPLETQLLLHVPSDLRDTCTRAELRPNETASVQCSPDRGASVVFYNQYPTVPTMTDEYLTLIEAGGLERNTGATEECPFEGELTVDEAGQGRVGCYLQDDGEAYLVWTNRPLRIQAEAAIADEASLEEFWDWWTTAGPVL